MINKKVHLTLDVAVTPNGPSEKSILRSTKSDPRLSTKSTTSSQAKKNKLFNHTLK